MHTNVHSICSKRARYRSIIYTQYMYLTNISTSAQVCPIAVVVCLNSTRVCDYGHVTVHRNQVMAHPNSNMHQYQRTPCSFKVNTIPFHIFHQHGSSAVCHCNYSWLVSECAIAIRWCHGASLVCQTMTLSNSNMYQYRRTCCLSKANVTRYRCIYTQYMYSTNIRISAKHSLIVIVVEYHPEKCAIATVLWWIVRQVTTNSNQNVHQ